MGFWHTGYIEFHEPIGFDPIPIPSPARFNCGLCDAPFESEEALRKHQLEAHPLRRPRMFLGSQELGTRAVRITAQISPSEVHIENCDRVQYNTREIPVTKLPSALSKVVSDTCRIVLSKSGVDAEFVLDIRVATNKDMAGVEEQFRKIASRRRLDSRAIEDFISAASAFPSALGYCDGICAYLYGILAKERGTDAALPHESYVGRFSKAVEELRPYNRPLAGIMSSLVEFHFNHFPESARLSRGTQVSAVASRYAQWIEGKRARLTSMPSGEALATALETLVTDWETQQIVTWSSRRFANLLKEAGDMELFMKRDLAEFDRVKLHVLLGELYAASDRPGEALEHAKALRNVPALDRWAEAFIRSLQGTRK